MRYRYETAVWSDRNVLHLQLELSDSGMVYEAGDAIGIVPTNPPELVANTLKRLSLSADAVFTVRAAGGGGQVSNVAALVWSPVSISPPPLYVPPIPAPVFASYHSTVTPLTSLIPDTLLRRRCPIYPAPAPLATLSPAALR